MMSIFQLISIQLTQESEFPTTLITGKKKKTNMEFHRT